MLLDAHSVSRRAALLIPLCLAACGFAPAYAPGGPGDRLRGRVAVAAPRTPDGYRLRAALEDRLGLAGPSAATLTVEIEIETVDGGILADGTPTRERLEGRARWRLVSAASTALAQGEERAFAGAIMAGPAPSVRATQAEARERLVLLLAERIAQRLLLLPLEALP